MKLGVGRGLSKVFELSNLFRIRWNRIVWSIALLQSNRAVGQSQRSATKNGYHSSTYGTARHPSAMRNTVTLIYEPVRAPRRAWRKLHIGVDADTGKILAVTITTGDTVDASQVKPLLDQVTAPVASFTADGAYDQDGVYAAVAARHPEATVVVPPRSSAVPSDAAGTSPSQRGPHLRAIAEHGRRAWQVASGYRWRAGRGRHQPPQAGDRWQPYDRAPISTARPRWASPSAR